RLDYMSDQVGIYAFEVRMGYRGLGYGRQMLEEAIRTIRIESQKRIMLDVETDNTNAIGLYLSCGFEIKTTYDYYDLKIS
ncbi:MAG TPA: GNAT family N-acetyltransferase, partial [Ktedonobacteraceae bacterium]|nr:GNAT family N-acetyltransferase [Ktedonobacteraceae bacterium]